jgi:hypothetical protein
MFTEDLRTASVTAAKALRSDLTSDVYVIMNMEMRQEADLVAETYHLLRSLNGKYKTRDFFLDYIYQKNVKLRIKEKRLKRDLIYKGQSWDAIVEFKNMWGGDIENGRTNLKAVRKGIITNYLTKLLSYRDLPNKIVSLTFIIVYLEPEMADKGQHYDLDQFRDSILDSISNHNKFRESLYPGLLIIIRYQFQRRFDLN